MSDMDWVDEGLDLKGTKGPEVDADRAVMKGFGLVRDADGKPCIDDPWNLPREIYDMLTAEEKEAIYHGSDPCYRCP